MISLPSNLHRERHGKKVFTFKAAPFLAINKRLTLKTKTSTKVKWRGS